uniref:Intersectin 2 n=1 Tax=Monodelphis domestica TaxID=13616 RepID=F7CL95_MONDO
MAQFSAVMNGGPNMWAITSEERTKHDKQFDSLRPAGGHITGDQARGFFLQSGLPASVLAEIWTLSDLNKDGKMDQQEFSIAMKLIKLTLQGQRLPPSLPPVMKQPPVFSPLASARFGMGSMPNLSVPPPGPPAAPLAPGSSRPSAASLPPLVMPAPLVPSVSTSSLPNGTAALLQPLAAPFSSATLPHAPSYGLLMGSFGAPSIQKAQSLIDLGSSSSTSSTASLTGGSPKAGASDWAVPQPSRLKYRQKFNSLDKGMTGYLSGLQARNALLQSNLSQTQLATICGKAAAPSHLGSFKGGGRPCPWGRPRLGRLGRGGRRPGDSLNGAQPCCERPQEEPPQKKLPVTFEDKRKANYERGNLELEKRRQVLLEQQQREAQRKAPKEKEELERKLWLLQEQEWRRQRELEKQRELKRQVHGLSASPSSQAAKQELERQRRLEWERIRRQELLSQRNREQEEIVRLQTRKKGLHLELEALGGKQQQISGRLEDLRLRKQSRRSELEALDRQCDLGVAEILELQQQLQESQKQLVFLVPEKQRLQEKAEHLQPDSSARESGPLPSPGRALPGPRAGLPPFTSLVSQSGGNAHLCPPPPQTGSPLCPPSPLRRGPRVPDCALPPRLLFPAWPPRLASRLLPWHLPRGGRQRWERLGLGPKGVRPRRSCSSRRRDRRL